MSQVLSLHSALRCLRNLSVVFYSTLHKLFLSLLFIWGYTDASSLLIIGNFSLDIYLFFDQSSGILILCIVKLNSDRILEVDLFEMSPCGSQ